MQGSRFVRGRAVDVQIETIQLLPHGGTALLADLTQIFSRRRHTGNDGRRIVFIECENVIESGGVDFAIRRDGGMQRFEQAKPAAGAGVRRLVETELDIDIDRSEERRVGKECRSRWSP